MLKATPFLLGLVFMTSCASAPDPVAAARGDLAPSGTLRAGINHGNATLAQKDPASGELRGIVVDLARELGRRLNVPVELVPYDAAGKMTEALKAGAWDVAFLAMDPARAAEISFTAPYIEIEGGYMVPADSPIKAVEDVDRDGVRVALATGGTPDLFLSRNLTRATIVRAASPAAAIDLFAADKLEAVAGIKEALIAAAAKAPGMRVLDGRFMVIPQAAGMPKRGEAGAHYLREFIEDVKASGLVAELLQRNGTAGATVAPSAAAR